MNQTPVYEYADRVRNVLLNSDTPLSSAMIRDLAGLQFRRGEQIGTALVYLEEKTSTPIVSQFRRGRQGNPFRVYAIEGTKAHQAMLDANKPKEKSGMSFNSPEAREIGRLRFVANREKERENNILALSEFIERNNKSLTSVEIAQGMNMSLGPVTRLLRYAVSEGLLYARNAKGYERDPSLTGRVPVLYDIVTPVRSRRNDRVKVQRDVLEGEKTNTSIITIPDEQFQQIMKSLDTPDPTPVLNEVVKKETPKMAQPTTPTPPAPTPVEQPVVKPFDSTRVFDIIRIKPDGSLVMMDAMGRIYVAKEVEV